MISPIVAPKGSIRIEKRPIFSTFIGAAMVYGGIMAMGGLPKEPASARIGIDENGKISGLF